MPMGAGPSRIDDDIAPADIAHLRDLFIFLAAAPCNRGHISLSDACLVQAVIGKARAVELVGAFGAPDIPAAQLGFRHCDEPFHAALIAGGRRSAAAARLFGILSDRKSVV